MKISAIIAEYNPFHNGHKYQIEKLRENGTTHVVAIMSGNYTQRGDFAIALKHARAESALKNGVDLVLEIPTPWAMSTAEKFAKAGVEIANALGNVNELAFGSECCNLDTLTKIAQASANPDIDKKIGEYLSEGISFAAAREKAISEYLGENAVSVLNNPNDILAIEYIKALESTNSSILPLPISRIGCEHDKDSDSPFYKSASELRRAFIEEKDTKLAVPVTAYEIYRQHKNMGRFPISQELFEKQMLYKLRTLTSDDFALTADIGNEGLNNKIELAVKKSSSIGEVMMRAKSKRYPLSRIRRIVMSSFLGLQSEADNPVPYIRVLGLNKSGAEVLKQAKDSASLPIILKYSDINRLDDFGKEIFNLECKFTDIYTTSFQKIPPCGLEMTQNPIVILE